MSGDAKLPMTEQGRRNFLKLVGGVSAAALPGYTTRQDGERTPIRIVTGPSAYYAVIMTYVQENNILSDKLNEAGYEIEEWIETFEERPLAAGGHVDITNISTLGGVQMTDDIDIGLVFSSRISTNFLGQMVKRGGPYDPDNTGGVEQSLEKISSDGAKVGVGTWGGGDVPAYQVIFDQLGYDFTQDSDDFDIVQTGYTAVGRQVARGRIAMGGTSPMHGVPDLFMQDPPALKPLFWCAEWLPQNGFGMPMQQLTVCNQQFMEEHEPAVKAMVDSWVEGIEWWWENGASAMEQEKYFKRYGWADTVEGAKYAQNWATKNLPNDEENPDFPVIYQNPRLTEDFIQQSKDFMNQLVEIGLIRDNWEEDISFKIL